MCSGYIQAYIDIYKHTYAHTRARTRTHLHMLNYNYCDLDVMEVCVQYKIRLICHVYWQSFESICSVYLRVSALMSLKYLTRNRNAVSAITLLCCLADYTHCVPLMSA